MSFVFCALNQPSNLAKKIRSTLSPKQILSALPGVVPIQGDDPYVDEGYTTPGVGAKLEEESKPDNRLLPRLDTVPPVGLGDGADAAAQAGGSGYE